MRTKRIRLTTAVTVLSSDDPVRVYEQFATLDLLSDGRAEIMAGRGSFIESFPLFGYDLDDYDALFAEKLELLLKIRDSEQVTWPGGHRAPLEDQGVYPRTPNQIADLGRGRRQPAIGDPRRRAQPADGARHHRRPAGALRAVRQPVRQAGEAAGHDAAKLHSASTPTAMSPTPRSRRPTTSSRDMRRR